MVTLVDSTNESFNDHARPPSLPHQLAADGLAAGFLDLGLKPGDTIAAWLPADDVDLHITQFGAAKAGLTLAVLDEGITREGIEKTLKETGARALIYAPHRGNTDNTALLQQLVPELASCESLLGLMIVSACACVVGMSFRVEMFPTPPSLTLTPPLPHPPDDDGTGVPFRSAKFPQLRHLIHTGFDVIEGVENLKHIFLPLEPERVSRSIDRASVPIHP